MRLTEQVHQLLTTQLVVGDFAIDATTGNGHDTLHLARLVGAEGRVLGIDLQAVAIEATRARLIEVGMAERVRLEQADHAERLEKALLDSPAQIAAIVFNLGYLPGGDKSILTEPAQTRRALRAAGGLLRPHGLLCVTTYRAHPGGEAEAQAVAQEMQTFKAQGWSVESQVPNSPNHPPILWSAHKPSRRG